ncbi:HxlR family transcriptional regulator [Haloactinopolyspora alba]|uniref:HxlR family transcriptional regulator n=1 Tax=Haloactinopolyspora alba TaxID=648780 RepID=A0A2P8E550_9ACTN|nr:helix-turn-helix domain-containing protein [Haloactinopolyspora alba]PSL04557.1 HxlR family transcriptional regulator [Haloactinopolyspora alba]
MDRDRFATVACSIARTAGVVADPWTLLVLRDLFLGVHRYEELRRDLGVATNVLADRLDRLTEAGLISRHEYQRAPVRHEYRLTDAGHDLYGVVLSLMAWGDRHLAPDGPPMLLTHDTCGHDTAPVVACGRCGGELTDADVTVAPGPGGRHAPGTTVIAERLAGPPEH